MDKRIRDDPWKGIRKSSQEWPANTDILPAMRFFAWHRKRDNILRHEPDTLVLKE